MQTAIIILAAGASQRMGTPKQVLKIEEGKSLLRKMAETALKTTMRPVVVVVGANKKEVVPELSGLGVTIIDNPMWQEGMSSSVRMGLAGAYLMDKQLEAVLMLVCDQPYVTAPLLEHMLVTLKESGKKAVACRYGESWGVPVLIGSQLFEALTHLKGEQGAKPLLAERMDDVAFVEFDQGEIDIDTPDDYRRFLAE
ncbi:nucleotidyltransferase family protein [Telluribacter sp.]|jgi:molybdenum cofactor cytidylyltransferase|uniref:nucleotidyltransferase family protein n=1 Tax=Telluribacter sp. TaxID=1978767 RepID=UPI002E0D9BEB|nr:nucleotidyltransferase family protein [Telluribacter sp.]